MPPLINPKGDSSGSSKTYKGGSWDSGGVYSRSTNRNQQSFTERRKDLGLRVVLEIP